MLIIIFTFIIGFAIGAVSAYHTKACLGFLVSALLMGGILIRPFMMLGITASGSAGSFNPFLVYWMGFQQLPQAVQYGVMFFPLFIVFGRLVTWIFHIYFEEEKIETEDEKRTRLLAEFGWEDIRKTQHNIAQPRQASSVSKSKRAMSFGRRI